MWIRSAASIIAITGLISCGAAQDQLDRPKATTPASGSVDELSEHHGAFCPTVLPRAERGTYDFGDDQPAAHTPTLSVPHEAWICRYIPRDVAPKGSNGAWYEWVRQSAPRRLDADELEAFTSAIEQLRPKPPDTMCTMDLGPRYLVSYVDRGDLTGVVMDNYGCGDVRLTDDPFTIVPGDPSQPGLVAGVLLGPTGLLGDLHAH